MKHQKLKHLFQNIKIGGTPSRGNDLYFGGGIPWVSIADMSNQKVIIKTKDTLTELGVKKSNVKLIKKGSLLFSFKLSVGKVSFAGTDLYTNEAIAAFEDINPEVDLKYLYYCLPIYALKNGRTNNYGAALLNKNILSDIQIPLPPLTTQRAIAERLDQIQELIDLKKQALAKTDELAKAIFLEMFGDLRVNSKGWEEKIFTDVVVLKRGHDLPVQERKEGLYPVIASSNIVGYHHTYKAEGPGIVTGRSGTIGEVQYIEGNYWPLNTTLYSETLKGNNPIYVLYFLRSFELNRYVRGAGVPTLNRNLFNTEFVPLPPLPLQQHFADIITEIEAQKNEHKQALAKLEELYQAEMQRSFSF